MWYCMDRHHPFYWREREGEQGSTVEQMPFHFRFSPPNGATSVGERLRLCGCVAAARHALHANEFQANQYPFSALPSSAPQTSHYQASTHSTLTLRDSGGNGAHSNIESLQLSSILLCLVTFYVTLLALLCTFYLHARSAVLINRRQLVLIFPDVATYFCKYWVNISCGI